MTQEQLDDFRTLETKLHRKEVRNSPEEVDALLADEFMEFGKSGRVFRKQGTLDALRGEQSDLEVEVDDFDARELAPTVVLVTYRATSVDHKGGVKIAANRSSVWIQRDGRWQMAFHQGTKAMLHETM